MRTAVTLLNVLSVLALVVIEPVALYVGAWGLLGPAYGDNGSLALGLVIMAAPVVIVVSCVAVSIRRMRAGASGAVAIAAAPLVAAAIAGLGFAALFMGH